MAKSRRGGRRGVTLVEVLIVVAIIALISGGVGIAALKYWDGAQRRSAETNARTIRGAVKSWWLDHDRASCPGVGDLIASGTLDRDSARVDPWGEPWEVACVDDEVTVASAGRDRRLGTEDDIRIPPV
jgi:general secretion pathway protein G